MNAPPKLEKVLYTAKAHTTGGREGGSSRTNDGRLDVKISPPGTGTGTNPEQLFAAGWSTCFLSAIKIAANKAKVPLPPNIAIDTEVDLGIFEAHYTIAARLNIHLPGVDHDVAQSLAETAHTLCPYSRATRGNIDVTIRVTTDENAAELADQTAAVH